MDEPQVQMEGIVEPKYNKRRKGYTFALDGIEIFVKGEDKDAAMLEVARALDNSMQEEESAEYEDDTMLAFAEGGLLDEGGSVDPISGNEVPPGSTQEEVRDDIPAQLSEGEFVFPADVVRYIGLENLMKLRQKAKQGLQTMDAMGQMGNSEEAIMDDTGEYEDNVSDMIESIPEGMGMAEGGYVSPQITSSNAPIGPPVGNMMPGQAPMPTTTAFQMQPPTAMNRTINRGDLTYAQGGAVMPVEQEMMQKSRKAFARGGAVMSVEQEMMQKAGRQNFQVGGMPQPVPTVIPPTQVPTYSQFMGQRPGQGAASPVVYGTDQYIGPSGDIIGITTVNGQPVQDVPAGYKKYNPATDMPAQPAIAEPEVVEDRGGDGMEQREREQEDEDRVKGYVTTMNTLASVSPTFAEAWSKNPQSKENLTAKDIVGTILGGPLGGAVKDFASISAANKEAPSIANQFGLDIENYVNTGLSAITSKYDLDRLATDVAVSRSVAESLGMDPRDLARTDIDTDDDGRISADEARAAERDLFMDDEISDAEIEALTRDDSRSFAAPDYAPSVGPQDVQSDNERSENNEVGGGFGSTREGQEMGAEANPDRDDGGFGLAKGGLAGKRRKNK